MGLTEQEIEYFSRIPIKGMNADYKSGVFVVLYPYTTLRNPVDKNDMEALENAFKSSSVAFRYAVKTYFLNRYAEIVSVKFGITEYLDQLYVKTFGQAQYDYACQLKSELYFYSLSGEELTKYRHST